MARFLLRNSPATEADVRTPALLLVFTAGCSEYGLADSLDPVPGTGTPTVVTDDEGTPPEWEPGLYGGHFDVDTSSFVSPVDVGSTDGHVHQYDDKYDVDGVEYFALLDRKLHQIDEDIPDRQQKFKLLVANAAHSPAARLSINTRYARGDASSYMPAVDYDDIPLAALRVYSLDGGAGATALSSLGVHFELDAILNGELIPTQTGCVQDNELGPDGSWRNGALTIQAVAVRDDGSDAFETALPLSAGGVHGVAQTGLLWETTLFWHWDGACFSDPDWDFAP